MATMVSMNSILNSIHTHPTYWALGTYYVFSNAVSALPTPNSKNGFYAWMFDFGHGIAGNLARVIATRYPQAPAVQPQEPPKQ